METPPIPPIPQPETNANAVPQDLLLRLGRLDKRFLMELRCLQMLQAITEDSQAELRELSQMVEELMEKGGKG